jgi:hypothetical protein
MGEFSTVILMIENTYNRLKGSAVRGFSVIVLGGIPLKKGVFTF